MLSNNKTFSIIKSNELYKSFPYFCRLFLLNIQFKKSLISSSGYVLQESFREILSRFRRNMLAFQFLDHVRVSQVGSE